MWFHDFFSIPFILMFALICFFHCLSSFLWFFVNFLSRLSFRWHSSHDDACKLLFWFYLWLFVLLSLLLSSPINLGLLFDVFYTSLYIFILHFLLHMPGFFAWVLLHIFGISLYGISFTYFIPNSHELTCQFRVKFPGSYM